ncbi:MIF4G domain-containing protein [Aspergillus melleus]|uniref:MIF4G domain-containing protein n=1 Tax=Aspergillus melleus TaxID=138277 RepID=UPI001E8CC031|nr:suppressor of glycerol defect [Aspergillus melleus]KAH8423373.1 suppressor of glycerol defect [Aspergillus melleus]
MPRLMHNTTSLPRNLRVELDIKDHYGEKKKRFQRNGPASRKDRRREERNSKKTNSRQGPGGFHGGQRQGYQERGGRDNDDNLDGMDSDMGGSDDEGDVMAKLKAAKQKKAAPKPSGEEDVMAQLKAAKQKKAATPKAGAEEDVMAQLKAAKQKQKETQSKAGDSKSKKGKKRDHDGDEDMNDVPSAPKVSRAVQEKLDQDDAEIAALEKRLGLKKGKKLPKSFADDGLDDLLGDLDDGSADEGRKRKREADDWLRSKRRKAQGLKSDSESGEDDSDMGSDMGLDDLDELEDGDLDDLDDMDDEDEDDEEEEGDEDDDAFGEFDEDDEDEDEGVDEEEDKPAPKKRENPYVAPVAPEPTENKPQKYIPPSLRAASNSESETLIRLRRQAQGHLNKLSEANMVSILSEYEKLYRDYPRGEVTSTLINLLFGLICERSALQDTFVILHAGFIAAVYKVVGIDFGAQLVQKIVEMFDAGGDEKGKFEGKEAINLISLLSQLYNFHVIGSTLIFDYIRLFLQEITEENTELLLKIIRNSGPQLRQDDPSSLKDIVLLIQPAVAKAGEAALTVRTKFMIDTITDLKNNRMKSGVGVGSTTVTSEHITKMRKILGGLNNSRVIRATEPISISRDDIHNASKKGKWWLVGASWKEDPLESARNELSATNQHGLPAEADDSDSEGEPDYASLAKAHRMNTDVRRSIFVAIMSAPDYQDAHVRLLKLRLKRAQEYEIPRVLTHCAMEEEAYNPYYMLIARRLCGEMGRRIKISFMYTLWNIFKRMGETGADEDEDDDFHADDEQSNMPMKSVVNLAKFYGTLIADGTLNLGILKTLNFAYLQSKTSTFVELLLITTIQQSQKSKRSKKDKKKKKAGEDEEARDEQALMEIFMRTRDTPQVVKGLMYFIRKVVSKSDIVSEKEQKVVRWGCKVAVDALKVVAKESD